MSRILLNAIRTVVDVSANDEGHCTWCGVAAESRVIFELSDLTHASPGAVSRCTLVHCAETTVPWLALFESWSAMAKQRWVINTLR